MLSDPGPLGPGSFALCWWFYAVAMDGGSLKVVLVGGSGFLGRGLRARLSKVGHKVTVIGRRPSNTFDGWRHVQWDGKNLGSWTDALEGADVIVHLAGKRVDCPPTPENIDQLISSREGTVRLVGKALEGLDTPPSAWVQLSSLAIFGDSGDEIIDESTIPPTTGIRQQVEVCQRWEAAFRDVTAGVERTTLLRPAIGIGGPGDPATFRLARLARFRLAGPVGSGTQWVSWIGAPDFFNILEQSVLDPSMEGLYHLTAPNPVQNKDLMAAYRKAVGQRIGLPAPAFITKIGARVLKSDPDLPLTGRRGVPTRLLADGYSFEVTNVYDAVDMAVNNPS